MGNKKNKIVLAIAGEIAAGKNEMADYVAKKYNGESYRSSEVLRDILKRLYLPENRENMQKVSTMIRENFGEDIISKVSNEDLMKVGSSIIAINGVRRISDIESFKNFFDVSLIYIKAKMENRYNRVVNRAENSDDKKKTMEEFKQDHSKEAESQICELESKADFVIENNETRKDFYKKIDKIIKKLILKNESKKI